jgi:hypothetical protein
VTLTAKRPNVAVKWLAFLFLYREVQDSTFFLYIFSWGGVRLSPLGTSATNWPIVPGPDDRWWVWSGRWNENLQGEPKYSEKTCPNATLSTTNLTWPDPGSNQGRRGGKPTTNRLSYGTATGWHLTLDHGDFLMHPFLSYFAYYFIVGRQIILGPESELNPWAWFLLQKAPVAQLLKNLGNFYGTQRFITVFQ